MSDPVQAEMVRWAARLAEALKDAPGFGTLTWKGYGVPVQVARDASRGITVSFDPGPEPKVEASQ